RAPRVAQKRKEEALVNSSHLALAGRPYNEQPANNTHFTEALRIFVELVDQATDAKAHVEKGLALQAEGRSMEAKAELDLAGQALASFDPSVLPAKYLRHIGFLYLERGAPHEDAQLPVIVSRVLE